MNLCKTQVREFRMKYNIILSNPSTYSSLLTILPGDHTHIFNNMMMLICFSFINLLNVWCFWLRCVQPNSLYCLACSVITMPNLYVLLLSLGTFKCYLYFVH